MTGASALDRAIVVFLTLWLTGTIWSGVLVGSVSGKDLSPDPHSPWNALISQAETLGLPTRFLRLITPGFVTLEFESLHTFAAEYHPAEHRMVLNRSLSFNAAGGTLRPLAKLTHSELGTLYHELFHAYMDFIQSEPRAAASDPDVARLLAFAEDQQRCRYQVVAITPVLQRKSVTEIRYLTDRESWEALNETWAVFVGWAIWTKLELQSGREARGRKTLSATEEWVKRLKKADRDGDLTGYYEPEDPTERGMTNKRYLAPSHRLSPSEVALLLEVLFGEPVEAARRSAAVMEQDRPPLAGGAPCQN
ncbi:MAG: hypothetical protein HY581_03330 [Nitrospirae bacterium]|nr:hypothetical protein [Nitrospirota bacterium]